MAAEFLHNGTYLASGDSLNIHFRQSKLESLLATHALLQRVGVKVHLSPHLRNTELNGPKARGQGLGLKAVGVSKASFRALFQFTETFLHSP